MIVAQLRNNKVYHAVKELYEMELAHEVRAERIGEALDKMKAEGTLERKEMQEYNDYFGIHKEIDHEGCYVTKVKHPNNEFIIVTRYAGSEVGSDGERGLLTIQGRRAKKEEAFFLLTPETMLEAIRRVRAETFITPFEKERLLDALLEF